MFSSLIEHLSKLNVDEFGYIVFEKVEQWFVNVFPGHGDLDSRLSRIHLFKRHVEVNWLIASVAFTMYFAV